MTKVDNFKKIIDKCVLKLLAFALNMFVLKTFCVKLFLTAVLMKVLRKNNFENFL